MEFRYRYVKFGTKFTNSPELRSESTSVEPAILCANELAVDVGGSCWDFGRGDLLPVIDHHFHREEGQFPSAAAAVLHYAAEIQDRFRDISAPIYLVTHRQPDFDAFAAMYLARGILQGRSADEAWSIPARGWEEFGVAPRALQFTDRSQGEIDWFKPISLWVPEDRRWAMMIASVASCVDNCKSMACPKTRTLHAVLYAAIVRGRDFEPNGAELLFDTIRDYLTGNHALNPFYDSVLEDSPLFCPELRLLDRELDAYERDIKRARLAVVYVPQSERKFGEWYSAICQQPLFDAAQIFDSRHLTPDGERLIPVDGIYLRDPSCLLFKEWARQDSDYATLGKGFIFTAIAFSGRKTSNQRNSTEYYFSLDPERMVAERLHLYPAWAVLQAKELKSLTGDPQNFLLLRQLKGVDAHGESANICRDGFELRAGEFGNWCNDPWFDGSNYNCTLIATPDRGTFIGGSGQDADLGDDAVASLVAEVLESPALYGGAQIYDIDWQSALSTPNPYPTVQAAILGIRPPSADQYRFGRVQLVDTIDPTRGVVGEQLGKLLWKLLHGGGSSVPADFVGSHLIVDPDSVQVWSRAGVMTAMKGAKQERALQLEKQFVELIQLASAVSKIAARTPKSSDVDHCIQDGDALSRRIVAWRQQLSLPGSSLLRRFFEATNLAQILQSVHDVNNAFAVKHVGQRLDANLHHMADMQNSAEWLELFIVSFYALELANIVAHHLFHFDRFWGGAGVLGVSLMTACIMAIATQPWNYHAADAHSDASPQHSHAHSVKRMRNAMLCVIGVLILFFVGGSCVPLEPVFYPQQADTPQTPNVHKGDVGHGH